MDDWKTWIREIAYDRIDQIERHLNATPEQVPEFAEAIWERVEDTRVSFLMNLYERWQEKHAYEDFSEYRAAAFICFADFPHGDRYIRFMGAGAFHRCMQEKCQPVIWKISGADPCRIRAAVRHLLLNHIGAVSNVFHSAVFLQLWRMPSKKPFCRESKDHPRQQH